MHQYLCPRSAYAHFWIIVVGTTMQTSQVFAVADAVNIQSSTRLK
jgi:hypothetical protein